MLQRARSLAWLPSLAIRCPVIHRGKPSRRAAGRTAPFTAAGPGCGCSRQSRGPRLLTGDLACSVSSQVGLSWQGSPGFHVYVRRTCEEPQIPRLSLPPGQLALEQMGTGQGACFLCRISLRPQRRKISKIVQRAQEGGQEMKCPLLIAETENCSVSLNWSRTRAISVVQGFAWSHCGVSLPPPPPSVFSKNLGCLVGKLLAWGF